MLKIVSIKFSNFTYYFDTNKTSLHQHKTHNITTNYSFIVVFHCFTFVYCNIVSMIFSLPVDINVHFYCRNV